MMRLYQKGLDVLGAVDIGALLFHDNLSVTLAQKNLKAKGYSLGLKGIDGRWGPATRNAVEAFLTDQGERDYPADLDAHVLAMLGITPNADMMSKAIAKSGAEAHLAPAPSRPVASASRSPRTTDTEDAPELEPVGPPTWKVAVAGLGVIALGVGTYWLVTRERGAVR